MARKRLNDSAVRGTKVSAQKRCRICGRTDNLCADFSNRDGKRSLCRECNAVELKAYRQRQREGFGSTHKRIDSPVVEPLDDNQLATRMRALLAARHATPWSIEALSDEFDVGVSTVKRTLAQLVDLQVNLQQSEGGGFWISNEIRPSAPTVIPLASLKGQPYRFGVTADNHLGSKYARLDVLNALYDIWADQGITTVYQCGNMIDGEARFNKGDLLAYGIDGQASYFAEHWPQRPGITTYFITGDDHEGWYIQREGINIGKHLQLTAEEAGRTDLKFLGHMEHDIVLQAPRGKAIMRLIHAGGGSAYATSYSVQKIVESYQGGQKPQILLVGHYHKAEVGYPREVHVVQVGATQDQTPFLRKHKIQSMLGGYTISFEQSEDGIIHGFTTRFDPFFDRDFYESDQWKYHWTGGEPTRKRRAA